MKKLLVAVLACLMFGCGSSGVSEPNGGDQDRESVEADSDASSQDGDKETDASESSEGSSMDGDSDSDAESAAEQETTESEPMDGDSESADGGDSDTEGSESSESSETPDGDSAGSSESDSEFEPYEIPAHQACSSDLDCPAWYSCDLNTSICVIDQYAQPCTQSRGGITEMYICSLEESSEDSDDSGKCLPTTSDERDHFSNDPITGAEFTPPDSCEKDNECPVWYSCDLRDMTCTSDSKANPCYSDVLCAVDYICDGHYYGDTPETSRSKCTRINGGGYCKNNTECDTSYTCDESVHRCIACCECTGCLNDTWCRPGLVCSTPDGTLGKCDYAN